MVLFTSADNELWLALRRGSVTIVGLQALCFQGLADKKC